MKKSDLICQITGVSIFPGTRYYILFLLIGIVDIVWIRRQSSLVITEDSLRTLLITNCFVTLGALLYHKLYQWLRSLPLEKGVIESFHKDIFGRAAKTFQGLLFMCLGSAVLLPLDSLLVTINQPNADLFMMRADRALRLDWQAYYLGFISLDRFLPVAAFIYSSLWPVCSLIFTHHMLTCRVKTAQFFILTLFVSALAAILIGAFFPARGPVIMELYSLHQVLEHTKHIPGTYFVVYIQKLHDHIPISISFFSMPGVTFLPSFHTSAALIMVAACRHTRLFWPVTLYATLMVLTVPVIGGHYFIDMLAGALLAALVSLAYLLHPDYRALDTGKEGV